MKRIVLISLALAAVPLSACTRSAASPAYQPVAATPRYEQPASTGAIYDVQRRLSELGYYRGPIDGVWGGETRTAVERFQANRRLAVSGDLNEATVTAMGLEPRRVLGRNYVAPPPAPAYERPVASVGPVTTRAVQEQLRHIGFYHGRIDGVWGQDTRLAMEQFQHQRGLRVTGTPTRQAMNALGLRSESFMSGSSVPPPSVADELNREEYSRQWR